ncbi:MAG: 2-dehydropantoate 2-reductase N-terminal domain-containing protein [Dehalococcoidia bacterium]
MRYIIYGAGAVGGVIGGRLFQHGFEVVLIARGAHLETIRTRGIRLDTPDSSETLGVGVAGHPSEIDFRDGDAVILTMKTQDAEAALADLRAAAGADVPVFCAQNGVENERLALRRFANVYGVMVVLPATHMEPGVVRADTVPVSGALVMGRYPEGDDATAGAVAADLCAATLDARTDGQVMRWKYAKLLANLGNALQAICGTAADAGELLREVRAEALACYKAAGIEAVADEELRALQRSIRTAPSSGALRQGGSSWQSLARATGSIETDFLNGEIALLGRLHGVPTPVNAMLQEVADRLARERREPGSRTVGELRQALAAG